MNDFETPSYKLPKGGEDFNRLNAQHRALTLVLGGLYPPEFNKIFERILRDSDSGGSHVLDVGCGPGIWSLEMARSFPQARIVGVDMTQLDTEPFPPNFEFKSYNLVNGLPPEYKSKFDIVHCRSVCRHVPDPQSLIDSMAECLKPGGFLLVIEMDHIGCFDEHKRPLESFIYNPSISLEENIKNEEGHSWQSGWLHALLLAFQSPKYEPAPTLIKRSRELNELQTYKLWLPANCTEREPENEKEIGRLILQDWLAVYKLNDLIARQSGASPQMIDHWRNAGLRELTAKKSFVTFRYTVASKS